MNSFSDILKSIVYVIIFIALIAIGLRVSLFLFKVLIDIAIIGFVCWGVYKGYNYMKMKIESHKYNKNGYKKNDDGVIDVKYEKADNDKQ